MKKQITLAVLTTLLVAFSISACISPQPLAPNTSLALTSFSENSVDVSLQLERDADGNVFLAATFTPAPDHHLYSKDLPRDGVDGLGRPTLLELTPNSAMTALGPLEASVAALDEVSEVATLSVYPPGPVTLRLAISLPPGDAWVDEEISLTFMACSAQGCKPPVEGRIVTVRVPGADAIPNP
jgi:hypothetical protein